MENQNPNLNPNQNNPNFGNPYNQQQGNQNFGNPYQNQYGQGSVPPGQMAVPNSVGVLVLGIISLVGWACYGLVGLICAIIALVLAKKANEAYNANPSQYTQSSYSNLKAGRVCAIIGLILSSLTFVAAIIFWVMIIAGATRSFYW